MRDKEDQNKPKANRPKEPVPRPEQPVPEPPPFRPDYSLITYLERSRKPGRSKRDG